MQQARGIAWLGFVVIYVTAWKIQSDFLLNWDVSYFLHALSALIQGGNYLQDFFNPNPPLILFLYAPPLWISLFFKIHLVVIFKIYIFLLASISLYLCNSVAKNIFKPRDYFIKNTFMLSLAAVYLILPFYEFGQRDHLLFMLCMPYVLQLGFELQSNNTQFDYKIIIIGLLAGLAFCIKPQFLILPLSLEVYCAFYKKNYLAWRRPEIMVMVIVAILYGLVLLAFFQDYLFVVTPFLIRNYYSGVGDQWYTLLDNHTTIASSFPVLLYLLLYKKNTYQQFSTVLVISLLGFVAIYFAQHNNFYYHLLPFFSASIVLSAMFFTILARQSSYTVVDYVSIILFEIFLTLFLLSYLPVIWVTIVLLPNQFFIFFAAVFSFLLLCYRQSLLKISTNLFLVLGISYICFYIVHRIAWSTHQFIITTVLLLLIFSLLAPRKCNNVFGHIVVATLGIMLLAHPIFTAYSVYGKSLEFKDKALNPLISFINKHDGQHSSFYFLSNKVSYSASLINYTQSKITQRFDCLWPVVSFIKNKGKHSADENAFINMIADDLYLQKPDLVFVDLFDKKLFDIDPKFDFIAYLSQNDKFRQEWKAYHRLTDLGTAFNYKVRVFERKKP